MKTTENTKTLQELIKVANESGIVFNKNRSNIPADITAKLEKLNETEIETVCKYYASMTQSDFIKAFFAVELSKNIAEKDIEKAVKNAVSVTLSDVKVTETGLIEECERIKSITFAEIFKAKTELLAFSHSDKKVTAKDKADTFRHFFGNDGVGYCDLLTHSARCFMSIGTETDGKEKFKMSAEYVKTFEKVEKEYTDKGKENPFKKASNTAFSQQITDTINYFIPENETLLNAYHFKGLAQIICFRNKFGKATISDTLNVFNALAIIYRYAFNGYKLPTNNRSTIYDK